MYLTFLLTKNKQSSGGYPPKNHTLINANLLKRKYLITKKRIILGAKQIRYSQKLNFASCRHKKKITK